MSSPTFLHLLLLLLMFGLFLYCYIQLDLNVFFSFPDVNLGSFSVMSDMKRLFYVWFLGAKECRGLRGDEFVRPIVR